MKAIIADEDALHALGPAEVAAYLRSKNWQSVDFIGAKGAVWSHVLPAHTGGGEAELLLPLDRGLSDYVRRMSEVLHILEVTENRSQLDILRDLGDADADVIRVRFHSAAFDDGSVPLEQAASLVAAARDMMLAAACAATQPRLAYPARKPAIASEYMERVRLGQTERGSYVLAVRSLVPQQFSTQPTLFPDIASAAGDTPFARKVTLRLAQAIGATIEATAQVMASGDIGVFKSAVEQGVSANLCDALAGFGAVPATQSVSLNIGWASVRSVPASTRSSFVLPADTLSVLHDIARDLRENPSYAAFELRGPVVELKREEGYLEGQIVVAGIVDDHVRRVTVQLMDTDYNLAIQAHQNERPIFLEGELSREGRSYQLNNARNLSFDEIL